MCVFFFSGILRQRCGKYKITMVYDSNVQGVKIQNSVAAVLLVLVEVIVVVLVVAVIIGAGFCSRPACKCLFGRYT